MMLLAIGCIVPMLALCYALRMSLSWSEGLSLRAGESSRSRGSGRWEGLAEDMARRGDRVRPRSSDAATRRRHLAAVLPADARR